MADYNKEPVMEENKLRGQFKVEKKPILKRVVDFLFSDKIDSIGNYITYDVLGPAIRDLIYKSIIGAAGMAVYGSVRDTANPLERKYGGAQRDYSAMARGQGGQFYAQTQGAVYGGQYGYGINDISFDSKDNALYQIDRLKTMIAKYGKVRIADFYADVGYTPPVENWTIQGTGWYNLETAHPVPTSNGRWIIDFPPPVSINQMR